jgi:hypothetical protein
LLKLKVTWSISLIYWIVVLWWARKPNWLTLSRSLCSMCCYTIFRITFLNNLPVMDKGLIGCKFWRNFGSLPGFSNVINFSSFQDLGKWYNQRQCWNKCIRYTTGLLGRCLRNLFGIPPSPQAFLSFNEFAN